jgi:hypothetical protein
MLVVAAEWRSGGVAKVTAPVGVRLLRLSRLKQPPASAPYTCVYFPPSIRSASSVRRVRRSPA